MRHAVRAASNLKGSNHHHHMPLFLTLTHSHRAILYHTSRHASCIMNHHQRSTVSVSTKVHSVSTLRVNTPCYHSMYSFWCSLSCSHVLRTYNIQPSYIALFYSKLRPSHLISLSFLGSWSLQFHVPFRILDSEWQSMFHDSAT